MDDPVVKFSEFALFYGERMLFEVDSLVLERGVLYSVLGLNGSGKTTLLNLISGVYVNGFFSQASGLRTVGELSVYGSVIHQPQNAFVFNTSVLKNAVMGMIKPDLVAATDMLNIFGLKEHIDKNAIRLSGGERRKLMLVRTLMSDRCDILLVDEPFEGIDKSSREGITQVLKDHCIKNNITLIMPLHSVPAAKRMTDMSIFINNKKIILCDVDTGCKMYAAANLQDIENA